MTRWSDVAPGGQEYAARFDRLRVSGADLHGEADFCAELTFPGNEVLDAGCGTGRVAIELARRGRRCVGVDVDASMLAEARRRAPDLCWLEQDLATLDLRTADEARRFDLIVAAGNVLPLLEPGTEATAVRRLGAHLAPGAALVAGFGLDVAHLPLPAAPFGLHEYDAWCCDAGLELVARFATWDRQRFIAGGGYAVSIHQRVPSAQRAVVG